MLLSLCGNPPGSPEKHLPWWSSSLSSLAIQSLSWLLVKLLEKRVGNSSIKQGMEAGRSADQTLLHEKSC